MRLRTKMLILAILALLSLNMVYAQSVKFNLSANNLKPGERGMLRATLIIPQGQKQSFDPNAPEYFYLEASHPDISFGKLVYPKATKVVSDTEWQYYPQVTLSLPFEVKSTATAGEKQIKAILAYNLCFDSGMCNPPEEEEGILKLSVVSLAPDTAVSTENVVAQNEEAVEDTAVSMVASEPMEAEPLEAAKETVVWQEILKFILLAFLGGIILNITPCVLPILPIRIMSIMNQAQKDRSKVLRHTLVYTLGVLISFGVMGGVFIALQQAGESAGWGLQNQNPGFVISLMAIVFVFALSLLGIFEIHAPGMNAATKATSKGGYSGSFFGGIFAFLMAISCTGPFLGAALPFALKMAPPLMMLFFLTIGLGFAFPFLLIGMVPKALKIIPKPGDWMVLFKELMGFVLLYIVYTQLKTLMLLTDADYFLKVIWFMLCLGFAVWLYGRFVRMENSKATQWIFTFVSLSIIIASAVVYLPYKENHAVATEQLSGDMQPAPHAPEGWYIFNEALFDKLMAEGKPVFLDIGAAWCKNCTTNEKTVLFTKGTMQEFSDKGVVLLRGDFTKRDENLLAWIKKHDRAGVPFNALYIPGEEPYLFGELISKSDVSNALTRIKGE